MAHVIAPRVALMRAPRGRGGRVLRWAVFLIAALAAPRAIAAADDGAAVLERRVKAALLYRFLNYVEWVDAAFPRTDSPLTIGVAGADMLAAELAEFAGGRTVGKRPLVVRRVTSPELARNAQVLYVGRGEPGPIATLVRAASPHALVVTDTADGLRQGSVINFVIVEGQVRFEVSLDAANRRSLRLSSRLLSVAHFVHGAPP